MLVLSFFALARLPCLHPPPGAKKKVAITHLMDSAEAKLTAAASSAAAAVEEAERVTDLEQGASPEALMMSTMTEEGDRKGNERKLLVPW